LFIVHRHCPKEISSSSITIRIEISNFPRRVRSVARRYPEPAAERPFLGHVNAGHDVSSSAIRVVADTSA
jgi:hypothetical protein